MRRGIIAMLAASMAMAISQNDRDNIAVAAEAVRHEARRLAATTPVRQANGRGCRSKYMPHIGAKQRRKGAALLAKQDRVAAE